MPLSLIYPGRFDSFWRCSLAEVVMCLFFSHTPETSGMRQEGFIKHNGTKATGRKPSTQTNKQDDSRWRCFLQPAYSSIDSPGTTTSCGVLKILQRPKRKPWRSKDEPIQLRHKAHKGKKNPSPSQEKKKRKKKRKKKIPTSADQPRRGLMPDSAIDFFRTNKLSSHASHSYS